MTKEKVGYTVVLPYAPRVITVRNRLVSEEESGTYSSGKWQQICDLPGKLILFPLIFVVRQKDIATVIIAYWPVRSSEMSSTLAERQTGFLNIFEYFELLWGILYINFI